jgi:hypothetical protein
MAPAASPGMRGTHIEVMSNPSSSPTPRAGRRPFITRALVSWRKTTLVRPLESQEAAIPER